jgi:AcrR family transcriptional regulator
MPKASLTTGRTGQKKRTRASLVGAAADLMRHGKSVTVAEAAERAGLSRATAYRYFPTQESLDVEAASAILAAGASRIPGAADIQAIEPGENAEKDCVSRVEELERAVRQAFWREEEQVRLVLRSQMDLWLAMKRDSNAVLRRPRRSLPQTEAALAPLRAKLPERDFEILSAALALITGPEAIVTLLDAAGIRDPEMIASVRRFALDALLAKAAVVAET